MYSLSIYNKSDTILLFEIISLASNNLPSGLLNSTDFNKFLPCSVINYLNWSDIGLRLSDSSLYN